MMILGPLFVSPMTLDLREGRTEAVDGTVTIHSSVVLKYWEQGEYREDILARGSSIDKESLDYYLRDKFLATLGKMLS